MLLAAQAVQSPWWNAGYAALGALVAGCFLLIGGWRERIGASKARQEERAALRREAHQDRQQQTAERLVREIAALQMAYLDLGFTAARLLNQITGAIHRALSEPAAPVAEALDEQFNLFKASYYSWERAQAELGATCVLLADASLQVAISDLITLTIRQVKIMQAPLRSDADPEAVSAARAAFDDETIAERFAEVREGVGAIARGTSAS